jgi:hypothetical protein
MTKRQFLIVLGVWIMAFLFLGFPSYMDKIFSLITGLLIIVIALKFDALNKIVSAKPVSFVEHKNSVQTPVASSASSATVTSDTITKSDSPIAS